MKEYNLYYLDLSFDFLIESYYLADSAGVEWIDSERGASFYLVRACVSGYGYI